jgi:SAM-dependent methyltransferase
MTELKVFTCPICKGNNHRTVFVYSEPPQGEIRFSCSSSGPYYREIRQCTACNHYVSEHGMDLAGLYCGDYVNSNYGDEEGMAHSFNRIISLDASRSDNTGRVQRIVEFAGSFFSSVVSNRPDLTLLDVGSGLGVFTYGMKKAGWDCTAVETDERAVRHTREVVGVKAVHGDFTSVKGLGRYHVVTFNKVLEHVADPIAMLRKSRKNLAGGGFVYVEVPDGEMAEGEGKEREEFCIDHLHVFSHASLALMANRSGYEPVLIERLREPSTKFTLRGFLTVKN